MFRVDVQTAIIVNQGIAIAALEGNSKGATFMAERGVPFEVAHRVLTRPMYRREYDWQ